MMRGCSQGGDADMGPVGLGSQEFHEIKNESGQKESKYSNQGSFPFVHTISWELS